MIDVARRGPWTTAQVRLVAGCDGLALVALAVAASGSGGRSLSAQVVWLDVAVLGLVLAVVANGALFLAGRRAVGRRRLQLLPDVLATRPPPPPGTGDGRWWWLPGTTRAHVGGCQMIAGKPAVEVTPDRIRAERLARCELCR